MTPSNSTRLRRIREAARRARTRYGPETRSTINEGSKPFTNRWRLLGAGMLLVALFVLCIFAARSPSAQRFEIAYVGRFGNPEFERMHLLMLKKQAHRLSNSLKGAEFAIRVFDINNDPSQMPRVYDEIHTTPSIIAVIDNTWGRHMARVAPKIKSMDIALISMNADVGVYDYGQSAVFLGSEDRSAEAIVKFAEHSLDMNEPKILIGEADYQMTIQIEENLECDRIFKVGSTVNDADLEGNVAEFAEMLSSLEQSPTIFLSSHRDWGTRLIDIIDKHASNANVIAASSVLSSALDRFGREGHGNALYMLTRPSDSLSNAIFLDLESYKREDERLFQRSRFNNALFARRCRDTVSILCAATIAAKNSEAPVDDWRAALAKELRAFRANGFLDSPDVEIEFDAAGRSIQGFEFEVRKSDGLDYSSDIHLNSQLEPIPCIVFGSEIVEINKIDPAESTFEADLYYWTRIPQGDRPGQADVRGQGTRRPFHFSNLRKTYQDHLLDESVRDGQVYELHRMTGEFQHDFDLQSYPRDEHELAVRVEFVNDSSKIGLAFDRRGVAEGEARFRAIDLGEWVAQTVRATVDRASSGGLGAKKAVSHGNAYRALNLRIGIKRNLIGPLISTILPLLMIGAMVLAVIQLRSLKTSLQAEIMTVIFLAIVTFSVAYDGLKPSKGAFTNVDWLYSATLILVVVAFIATIGLGLAFGPDAPPSHTRRPMRYFGLALALMYAGVAAVALT